MLTWRQRQADRHRQQKPQRHVEMVSKAADQERSHNSHIEVIINYFF
ncbi:hypothetical protein SXCC_00307 [Gluconacetobacter sp. SXCC-1]|nr:hypothetical protein SXCC_00307 [Gluconacetobacter sp. SXCC-1]